jgi:hypothetical protein
VIKVGVSGKEKNCGCDRAVSRWQPMNGNAPTRNEEKRHPE